MLKPPQLTSSNTITSIIWVTCVSAAVVLFGWLAGIEWLKSISPSLPQMKPDTAVAFILSAISLGVAVKSSRTGDSPISGVVLAILVAGFGTLSLAEYLAGTHFVPNVLADTMADNVVRMSPHSAVNFILVGSALVLLGLRGGLFAVEILLMVARFISVAALLGLLYGARQLYGVSSGAGMAVHTSFLFLILTTGISLADRRSIISKLLHSTAAGGSVGRRVIPVVFMIPPVIGLVLQAGYERGLYDASFRLALTIGISMFVMAIILFYYSLSVDKYDIRRKEMEADLAAKEARYRELFDYSQGLMCIHDLEGNLTMVNKATQSLLGFKCSEMNGRNLRDFIAEEHHLEFDAYLRRVTNEGLADGILELEAKNGDKVLARYHNIKVEEDGRPPYILGHSQDVTELVETQKKLKELSLTDELTGLYNRRGFLTLAEQQLRLERHGRTARGLTLMFADMDGLKAINDKIGHEAGSDAIKTLAMILKATLRSADLVARWGGDEFVILTIGSEQDNAAMLVERIQTGLNNYNERGGKPYKVACSFGVAPVVMDGSRTFEEIIAEADEAMYAEKKRRKAARGQTLDPATPPNSLGSDVMPDSLKWY